MKKVCYYTFYDRDGYLPYPTFLGEDIDVEVCYIADKTVDAADLIVDIIKSAYEIVIFDDVSVKSSTELVIGMLYCNNHNIKIIIANSQDGYDEMGTIITNFKSFDIVASINSKYDINVEKTCYLDVKSSGRLVYDGGEYYGH